MGEGDEDEGAGLGGPFAMIALWTTGDSSATSLLQVEEFSTAESPVLELSHSSRKSFRISLSARVPDFDVVPPSSAAIISASSTVDSKPAEGTKSTISSSASVMRRMRRSTGLAVGRIEMEGLYDG